MLCKIADLITEIPEAGGMSPRCQEYLWPNTITAADIIIDRTLYQREKWPTLSENDLAYMESARIFYGTLLDYNGFYLHSSAIEFEDKAYLFSGPSGVGKSTHTRLWKDIFGESAQIFNDDKPALRFMDGVWYAYGTPWCGKDGINQNKKVRLAGICFLKQSPENLIFRLTPTAALTRIIEQTIFRYNVETLDKMDLMLSHVGKLVHEIPVFELQNRPEPAAAKLSYETLRRAAEEAGL